MIRSDYVAVEPLPSGQWVAESVNMYWLRVVGSDRTEALLALCDVLAHRLETRPVLYSDDGEEYDDED